MENKNGRTLEVDRKWIRDASNQQKPSRLTSDNGNGNGRRLNGFTNGFSRNGRINGLTNGLTNGLRNKKIGLYNGLVNGLDRKNGLINGNGFINGFRLMSPSRKVLLHRKRSAMRIATIIALSTLTIIIPFLLIFSMPTSSIKIDGYFFDWDRAGYLVEDVSTADADIDLREYSVVRWGNTIYCYIATAKNSFAYDNRTPIGFYTMLDIDNDPDTGYIADGIGADRMVEIIGWNSSAQTGKTFQFLDLGNRSDFNSFVLDGMVKMASHGNKIEFSFTERSDSNPTIRFFSKSCLGCEDASLFAIKYEQPAVRVQSALILPEIIMPSIREEAMTIQLETKRGDVLLSGLRFDKFGNASDYEIIVHENGILIAQSGNESIDFEQDILIREGYGQNLQVSIIVGEGQVTSSFGLSLSSNGIIVDRGAVVLAEEQLAAKTAYIGAIPTGVIIDGAFADWANGYVTTDPEDDVRFSSGAIGHNPAIDIIEYGMFSNDTDVALYINVKGEMCNGTILPKGIALPVPSQGLPPLESTDLIGADFAGAVFDTDLDVSTGANYSDILGADYLVFIAGKKGKVLTSELYRWDIGQSDGEWISEGTVRFGIDSKRMEIAFNMSLINLGEFDMAAVALFMSDWKESGDFSDSILPLARWETNLLSRAFGGIIINEVYNVRDELGWIELYNTGTTPISLSGWILYDKGTAIYYFGDIVLEPGEFLVITDLPFTKLIDIELMDDQGIVQDEVKLAESRSPRSWSRIGTPPYDKWRWTTPSPGDLNDGQVAIPEFSSIMIPILAMTGIFLLTRIRKRKVNDGRERNRRC